MKKYTDDEIDFMDHYDVTDVNLAAIKAGVESIGKERFTAGQLAYHIEQRGIPHIGYHYSQSLYGCIQYTAVKTGVLRQVGWGACGSAVYCRGER
ncbi:MAG: hypothetical protein AAFV53_38225 [Myxococcota bacterium]